MSAVRTGLLSVLSALRGHGTCSFEVWYSILQETVAYGS